VNYIQEQESVIFRHSTIGAIVNALLMVKTNNIQLLCHKNTDPDALGSAIALASFFKEHKSINCKIFAESLNKPAERLADHLNIEIQDTIDLDGQEFIITDSNNLEQLGTIVTDEVRDILMENPPIIIDHHAPHAAGAQLTNKYFSNTEIRPEVAYALLSGIVYDTKHFILASKSTLGAALYLMDHEVEYKEVLKTLNVLSPLSERMARLKAAQRMELMRIGDYLLTISHISAYEASAARSLIRLGADVAVVFTTKSEELRMSARCTTSVHTETGIHLGETFEKLAEKLDGMGGGHRTAAGLNSNTSKEPQVIIGLIQDIMKKQILPDE
jgi:nanoRNase/pAp phosphatase (c-di-AMP/oligoRNAs hydrolase)